MENKADIESKVDRALKSAREINPVGLSAHFADKTVNKLRSVRKERYSNVMLFPPLLKVAAIVILLIINIYTLQYVINTKQPAIDANPTISDFVNEYQPNDSNELTLEQQINEEQ